VKTKILRESAALPLPREVAPAQAPGGGSAEAAKRGSGEDGEIEDEQAVDNPDAITFEEAFFGIDTSGLAKEDDNRTEKPAEELNRYLAASRKTTTVNACFSLEHGDCSFPRLRELFLKCNTALPLSAGVESFFFSKSGHRFSSVRNVISDNTLEMEVMLKVNAPYWL